MEVNLMNILKEEGPSIHLAVGENYLMDMEAWIGQEHPHIFWSYLMSTSPDKDWPESECDNPGGSTDWDRWRPVRNQLED